MFSTVRRSEKQVDETMKMTRQQRTGFPGCIFTAFMIRCIYDTFPWSKRGTCFLQVSCRGGDFNGSSAWCSLKHFLQRILIEGFLSHASVQNSSSNILRQKTEPDEGPIPTSAILIIVNKCFPLSPLLFDYIYSTSRHFLVAAKTLSRATSWAVNGLELCSKAHRAGIFKTHELRVSSKTRRSRPQTQQWLHLSRAAPYIWN